MTTSGESPAGAPRKPRCVGGLRYGEQLSWVSPSGASDFSASDITVTASAAPPVPTIGTDPFYQIAAAVTAYNPGAFVRDFAVLSITTALTGPLAGVLGEAPRPAQPPGPTLPQARPTRSPMPPPWWRGRSRRRAMRQSR